VSRLKRRVLFVAHPYLDANMGGVRVRRIARLLPRFGWEVVVLTHARNEMSVAVESPPGVRVEEIKATDLASVYRRLRGIPANAKPEKGQPKPTAQKIGLTSEINRWLMIPDKIAPWRTPATRRGAELLRSEKFDAIFASLDPRTSLLVATDLSEQFGVPSVVEYRDLWIGNPYYHITQPTRFHTWIHQRLERKVLRRAHQVSAVCQGIANYLTSTYGKELRAPIRLNYNFFDPSEYPEPPAKKHPRPFVVSYTGAMYASRTPHQFFEGMRQFIDSRKLAPDQFRFRWAGGAAGITDLGSVIERTGITPYMDFLGMIPHREALQLLMESDVALLLQAPNDQIHIPGKLFEALGARVPLLALASPCEVTDIMERCNAGLVCAHTAESVAAGLQQFATVARSQQRWSFNEPALEKFSADSAVAQLSDLLELADR
jgi:hypothetical protein